jgi:DNA-binding transcriptional MocR family regulator
VPTKPKFTRIPKVEALVLTGVPTEVIPTYCCLADYANNKTGLCWPKMETLAKTLGRSVRTVQRHLHLLRERGLIEFVVRTRALHSSHTNQGLSPPKLHGVHSRPIHGRFRGPPPTHSWPRAITPFLLRLPTSRAGISSVVCLRLLPWPRLLPEPVPPTLGSSLYADSDSSSLSYGPPPGPFLGCDLGG